MSFERELALHGARLRLFEAEVVRNWERTSRPPTRSATALFLLLARDFAPFEERLGSMTQRIEAVPGALMQVRDRLGTSPCGCGWSSRNVAAAELPGRWCMRSSPVPPASGRRAARSCSACRQRRAPPRPRCLDYAAWIETRSCDAVRDRVALGRDELDELIGLRAFDGLETPTTSWPSAYEQLEAMHEARREAGRLIDPSC